MTAKTKTTFTKVPFTSFINSFVDNGQKKKDSFDLVKLMKEWSGYEPRMWGPSIIGFGSYHYKYASGHEGDAPVLGFSPRKAAITLYVVHPDNPNTKDITNLGKFKQSKGCIYFKKLSDLDLKNLEKLCKESLRYMKKNYEVTES